MRSKHNKGKLLPFQTQALTAFTLAVTATLVWAFTVQFGYAKLDNINNDAQTRSDNSSLNLPKLIVSPLLTTTYRDSVGNLHIVGEIQNNFTFPIQSIRIIATLYNYNNEVVTHGNSFTDIWQIRPGENTGFGVVLTDAPQNISKYTISASYERAYVSKPKFLAISNGNYYLDPKGSYHLTGIITNEGTAPAKFVRASGIFFGTNQRIVDAHFSYTKPIDLQPGQSASIDLQSSSPTAKDIKFGFVDAQSDEYSLINLPLRYPTQSLLTTSQQALTIGNTPGIGGPISAGGNTGPTDNTGTTGNSGGGGSPVTTGGGNSGGGGSPVTTGGGNSGGGGSNGHDKSGHNGSDHSNSHSNNG